MKNFNEFFFGACNLLLQDRVDIKFNSRIRTAYDGMFIRSDGSHNGQLIVNSKKNIHFLEDFPSIFIHEFSHYVQEKRNTAVNQRYHLSKSYYLNKPWEKLNKHDLKNVIDMEVECDQIAMSLIKKYLLEIDIPQYILEANLTNFSYVWTFYTGSQMSKKESYIIRNNLSSKIFYGFKRLTNPNKTIVNLINEKNGHTTK